ncbi:MAG: SBBP repeat-containing protein, partial [Candidatus Hermodarchaeota archaeon]
MPTAEDPASFPAGETKVNLSSLLSKLNEKKESLNSLPPQAVTKPVQLPFSGFIQNRGQLADQTIHYYYSSGGTRVSYGTSKITFVSLMPEEETPIVFTATFPGSHPVVPVGCKKKSHYINYFYGNWTLTNVPTYEEIWYKELYPSIDLRYYMSDQGLKYEFIVHPGADPKQIAVQVSESMHLVIEEQTVSLRPRGSSTISFQDTVLRVFQADGTAVAAQFILKDRQAQSYGFQLGYFNSRQALIIDPLLLCFSTFLGGSDESNEEQGWALALDSANNVYVTGLTPDAVTNFPTTPGAMNETHNGDYDVFVCKLSADGFSLVYSTFLGGSEYDSGCALAVDSVNNVYVTGTTGSTDFPTTPGAYSGTYSNEGVFVSKLSANGSSLLYSTVLGGDVGFALALDSANNAYVTGYTYSNFPTTPGANDTTHNGGPDVFVCKLSANGSSLVYSTFLGGSGDDWGYGLALDSANNVYVAGTTADAFNDFPTTPGAYNETHNGVWDAFVCKLSADGSSLVYSTFLGGSGADTGYALAIDSANNVYVTGYANDFPTTPGAYNENPNGGSDVFVCKLSADGSSLVYSTFLGGSGDDFPERFFSVDSMNNIYVTGETYSTDFPTTPDAYDETPNGGCDVFVCKLSADGSSLVYSTFLGGSGDDYGYALALDSANNIYITGFTWDAETDFPTTSGAINETHNGGSDVFVCKLWLSPPIISLTSLINGSIHQPETTIDLTITDDGTVSHVLYNWDGSSNETLAAPYDLSLPSGEGQHVLHVYANDTEEQWASQTYIFTTDCTPPSIEPPDDLTYKNGTTGHNITWQPTDAHPQNFTLYQNDTPIQNGTWDGSALSFNVDGLDVGTYNYTLLVLDEAGNTATATVWVTVIPGPSITTRPTQLNATEGVWFSFDFDVSSVYPILMWTLWGNGTAWLTIDPSTGMVTGTPSYLTAEYWNVTVVVTDVNGINDTYTVLLKVQPAVLAFDDVSPNQNVWLFDVVTLMVRIETTDGSPCPGVPVDWWLDGDLLGTNTTDADGFAYWTLQLTTARTYQLLAQVPARSLSTEIYIIMNPVQFWFNGQINETEPVWLPLGANYTISGQLVDGEGQPVAGIELRYMLGNYTFEPLVTDANGWVNLTQPFLSEGTYVLTVTKDGQELFMNGYRAELVIHVLASPTMVSQITPATNTTETVVNRPNVFVARIYFDELTPVALPGARIGLLVNGSLVDSQFSDVNGYVTFEYTFLASGTYFVAFYYNGRSWGGAWVTVTMGYFALWVGETVVNGTVGQPLEFTIYVQTNTTLTRGLILYMNDGTPVIGAAIDWYINDVYQETTMTGAEGATTFRHT